LPMADGGKHIAADDGSKGAISDMLKSATDMPR